MILLLEDKNDRAAAIQAAIRENTDEATIRVATADAAIRACVDADFDLLLLDHDLDQDGALLAAETGTGMHLIAALAMNPPGSARPPVIVHSKNLPAAGIMVAALLAAGYPAAWIPYPHPSGAQMDALTAAICGFCPRIDDGNVNSGPVEYDEE